MPYRIEILIGSDNNTGKIGKNYLEKIRKWVNKEFKHLRNELKQESILLAKYFVDLEVL